PTISLPPRPTLFPTRRSSDLSSSASSRTICWANPRNAGGRPDMGGDTGVQIVRGVLLIGAAGAVQVLAQLTLSYTMRIMPHPRTDRKSTRLNSSHQIHLVCRL